MRLEIEKRRGRIYNLHCFYHIDLPLPLYVLDSQPVTGPDIIPTAL